MIQLITDDEYRKTTLETIKKVLAEEFLFETDRNKIFNILRDQVNEYDPQCGQYSCYIVDFYRPGKQIEDVRYWRTCDIIQETRGCVYQPELINSENKVFKMKQLKQDWNYTVYTYKCQSKYFRSLKSLLKFLFNSELKVILRINWRIFYCSNERLFNNASISSLGVVNKELFDYKFPEIIRHLNNSIRIAQSDSKKYYSQIFEDFVYSSVRYDELLKQERAERWRDSQIKSRQMRRAAGMLLNSGLSADKAFEILKAAGWKYSDPNSV